ncbi:MAG TPA: hypothetical protein VLE95_01595 [Chlamydiales bacterium]|nr:hypothetical protein [Chlamydiales bacterium]
MIYFLIGAILVGASALSDVPDADGWVSVERPSFHGEEFQEDDPGTWIVFSKRMEGETFHIRLPADPSCQYFLDGIQLLSAYGNDDLILRVEKRKGADFDLFFQNRIQQIGGNPKAFLIQSEKSSDGQTLNLFYRFDDKWVWERVQSSSGYFYTFRTESDRLSTDLHRQFVDSLDVYPK